MLSIESIRSSTIDWLRDFWEKWRGALVVGGVFVALAVFVFANSADFIEQLNKNSDIAKSFAITIVVVFSALGLGLVLTFFWIFRGIKATEDQLDLIITYCYAFIVFALSASVLPFFALPLIPQLYDSMTKSPVGIVAGCSVAPISAARPEDRVAPRGDDKSVPRELRCDSNTDQWVVNIGGTVASQQGTRDYRPVQISGGLVVPLYAIVLALMGAAVSMTRRVPEFQRRISPGDPEFMTYDQAREGLVFQIMQVASAPLIALTAYYLVDPSSRASTIVLSFASGFSSETVLLLIRAVLEKLRPAAGATAARVATVMVVPAKLDFGSVKVPGAIKKSISMSNPGPAPLIVHSISCAGEFSSLTSTPFNIAPQASGIIDLEFKPTTAAEKQGQLTIVDNAMGSPRTVELSGTGIA